MKKNTLVRSIALLAIVLLIGVGIGGTLAWLIDSTYEVKNTFTVGNINIDLVETVYNTGNGKDETLSAKTENVSNDQFTIIPGRTETKDPTVIVAAGSEDCYVFVMIEESYTTVDGVKFVDWTPAAGWTKLTGVENVDNVYYRVYTGGARAEYSVLADNQVSYPSALTKAQIDAFLELFEEPSQAKPSLKFKAFAVQKEGSADAAAAWAKVG